MYRPTGIITFIGLAALSLSLPAASRAESAEPVVLPKPAIESGISLESAMKARRSVREYSNKPLSTGEVSALLWAAQGITARSGGRTAPSAGALYPLEVYLVAGRVDSLPSGVYRYQPRGHRLHVVAQGDMRGALASAALGQSWVRRAPAVIVIAGVYERSARKYGERASRYTHIEVGHAAQNVYLQAEVLDLGTVIVGAFHDRKVQDVLGLPRDHAPLALMPVGHRR